MFLGDLIPLLGGIDQDTLIPSLTGVMGIRTPNGYEIHVGPNITPLGTAFTYVLGMTFYYADLNIPVNLAFIPTEEGTRFSLLIGFNWK